MMKNPGLPDELWNWLDGRLWHATSRDAIPGILRDGAIQPAVGNRYRNSFCRNLKSVCLFDFGPSALHFDNQFNNWSGWFGHQQNDRMAIWFEIDRAASSGALIDAGEAHRLSSEHLSKKIISGVEACHKGQISLDKVLGALLVARDNHEICEFFASSETSISEAISGFEKRLPPERQDSIIAALLAARRR
jgi:hypothetical protein